VFLLAARIPIGPSRLGITVTRKVGCAVVRNRAKRLVRVAFRQLPGLLPHGVDMVVILRKPLSGSSSLDVIDEWRGVERLLWRRSQDVLSALEPAQAGGS
jgi:ribonuclease P protein component